MNSTCNVLNGPFIEILFILHCRYMPEKRNTIITKNQTCRKHTFSLYCSTLLPKIIAAISLACLPCNRHVLQVVDGVSYLEHRIFNINLAQQTGHIQREGEQIFCFFFLFRAHVLIAYVRHLCQKNNDFSGVNVLHTESTTRVIEIKIKNLIRLNSAKPVTYSYLGTPLPSRHFCISTG